MGAQAQWQEERMKELRAQASTLFVQIGAELDTLAQLVDRAADMNPRLRCANPAGEILYQTFPAPALEPGYTLLAADGSQINPDRHAQVEFGAINVGAICMRPGQGQAPEERVRSQVMFHDALYTASGNPLTDDLLALMRDLAERRELVEMARSQPGPVVALTDGPLELYRDAKASHEFREEFDKYQGVLENLADLDVSAAGYVDRPRGDLLIRLLELGLLEKHRQLDKAGLERPLRGVTDISLLLSLLKPGERSAVLGIHSGSSEGFRGRLALHFFYLNVGREDHSYFSRVEIPKWVADSPRLINLLHACLLSQAHQLGARPYPYVLHRAHEIAVITYDEREQLSNMIAAEMRRQGLDVDERSNKQIAKDASNTRSR
jgi:hypothetical protein